MAEYERAQRNQLGRAIAYNGGGNKQLKEIVDNRFSGNELQSMIQLCKWKTVAIDKKIKAEQALSPKPKLTVTAHHTVPKEKLADAYDRLPRAEKIAIGKELIGVEGVLTPKQIKSLPFNLTLGPLPEQRSDDPKDAFDPNYSNGVLTPRSQALGEMFGATGDIDPTKIRTSLKKACDAHKVHPVIDRSGWVESGGKYHRSGKII